VTKVRGHPVCESVMEIWFGLLFTWETIEMQNSLLGSSFTSKRLLTDPISFLNQAVLHSFNFTFNCHNWFMRI